MNSNTDPPSFNLWTEPWITAEKPDGTLETVNIQQLIQNAPDYRALYDPSPLVIVSIHRLLIAILQDIFRPEVEEDLYEIWEAEQFPADKIEQFGREYADRFDIFSDEVPFMQSADIPLVPEKRGKGKSIGYLFQEENAGTGVTHYFHAYDATHQLCPACCAKGLVFIPAFASSGGAGIKPSINGVPPIYIIPGGETLQQSLTASLTIPNFQPEIADQEHDTPWWRREEAIVHKKGVVNQVGYLHSLTFPARRIRLHPHTSSGTCSRCQQSSSVRVSEMAFEMGEERPSDSALWRDPFAAYKIRKDGEPPIPIRPIAGKAIWREYEGLFLESKADKGAKGTIRPTIISQLSHLQGALPYKLGVPYPFQVVGVRTDMKAKTFEWEQSGFQVPPQILQNADATTIITAAIEFSTTVDSMAKKTFTQYFGGDGKQKRGENVKWRMSQSYWSELAQHFSQFINQLSQSADLDLPFHNWLDQVQRQAIQQFNDHAGLLGKDSKDLENKVKAMSHNRAKIYSLRNKNHPKPEATT